MTQNVVLHNDRFELTVFDARLPDLARPSGYRDWDEQPNVACSPSSGNGNHAAAVA